MANINEKEVAEGFTVQLKDSGYWLCFKANGKHASINVENKFAGTRIVLDAIQSWCEETLKRTK